MEGRIHQLNCSRGGVPKTPVPDAVLTPTGLEGDRVAHPRFHCGPLRALCLFSLELIRELQSEGHPIFPGSIGENVTVAGLDWEALGPGSRLAPGDAVVLQITGYASPCKAIAGSFAGGEFKRVSQKIFPGESRLYARVLRAGRLETGQKVRLLGGA